MRYAAKIVAARAGLGGIVALLVQALFWVAYDRRPAYALLIFLALAALGAGLAFLVVGPEPALWRRWRGALAGVPALLGFGFILLAAARWSVMWISYAGRPLVMGLGWLGVGMMLGSLLGVLDREGGGGGGAAAAFRRALVLVALPAALLVLLVHDQLLPAAWLPSPLWLMGLLAFCLAGLLGRGEPLPWRFFACCGAASLGWALYAGRGYPLLVLPPPASAVFWRLLKARAAWGAGPGALTLFIAHRPGLGPLAASAAEVWRYRIPAELGGAGVALGAAFVLALVRLMPWRAESPQRRELRRAVVLGLALLLLGILTPAFARPEFLLWLGLTFGLAIGLSDRGLKFRPYDGRLVSGVLLALAIGAMALAITMRQQLVWRIHLRGLSAVSQARWPEAIAFFEKAHQLQPDTPDFSIAKSAVYRHTADKGLESPYLVRAGAIDPYWPEIPAALGRWSCAHGRTLEATEMIRKALALDPGNKTYLDEKLNYQRQEGLARTARLKAVGQKK